MVGGPATGQSMGVSAVAVLALVLFIPPLRHWWSIPLLYTAIMAAMLIMFRRKMRSVIGTFAVPPEVPLVGHSQILVQSREGIFKNVRNLRAEYGSRFVLRILNEYAVNISDADAVEAVFTCTKNISKGPLYSFLLPWLGNGLLTSDGQHWASHRKMLTPAFHFSILDKHAPRLQHHAENFAKKLGNVSKNDPNGAVDLMPQITNTTLAAIFEVAMGVDLSDAGDEYVRAIHSVGCEVVDRTMRPWLWNAFFYKLLPRGKEHFTDIKFLNAYSEKVIAERKMSLQSKFNSLNHSVNKDEDNEVGIKQKLAFLDLLLTAQQNGADISDDDIRNEVNTFMFEGHDTTAVSLYWTLHLLADHPEIQERLREEVCSVELKDVLKLPYLERVLRESLRLYPSVPFISRQIEFPIHLSNNQVLAPPMACHIHFYDLHRDPKYFPDPLKFDPDRDYPSHPFAYVPFSGGSRNCIGRRFAMMELKLVIAATLRHLRLKKPPVPYNEVPIPSDLVLRPGIPVKIPVERL